MGAYQKHLSNRVKTRVITDLSWPPYNSVNHFIDKELCRVSYVTIDDAVSLIKSCGKKALLLKVDIEDAYRNIVVQPEDWHLLGTTWQVNGVLHYYLDTRLPFGLRSSARLFSMFAEALRFMMVKNGAINTINYLDDFLSVTPHCEELGNVNKTVVLRTCEQSGFPINTKKTVGPVTELEFLGIVIDTDNMELRMSTERLNNVRAELLSWLGKRSGTKRQLLSLLGKLVFMSRIIKPGRIFMRRIITCTSKLKQLHHKVRLSREARSDISWWLSFTEVWNKKSVFYDDEWMCADNDLCFFTDASLYGIGGVLQKQWFAAKIPDTYTIKNIAWKELYALIVACATWGKHFAGKKIIINCDNNAIVHSVNNGSSKTPELMTLIRRLYFIQAYHNFELKLKYVQSRLNIADLPSRLKIQRFLADYPEMRRIEPTFNSELYSDPTE